MTVIVEIENIMIHINQVFLAYNFVFLQNINLIKTTIYQRGIK
jgi:hypothetical protein